MIKIPIQLELYEYNELIGNAKERAFDDEYYFLLQNPAEYEDENGNMQYDNMEEWSSEEVKEYVEECIHINEYLYYPNGEMAYITRYVGNHSKAGTNELKLAGNIFNF